MRTRLTTLAIGASGLLALGCSHSSPAVLPPADSAAFTPALGLTATQPNHAYEFGAGGWRIEVDTTAMTAQVEALRDARTAQFNGDLFGLAIDQFFGGDALTVTGVAINGDGDLVLDIAIAHPFAGPRDLDAPASASNRADLGISGRLYVRCDRPPSLVTDENQPNHDGDYVFPSGGTLFAMNTKLLENAQGFGNPGDVGTGGDALWETTANVYHPYIVLVDEADPSCRASTSSGIAIDNLNGSAGNYDPVTGWSRGNIGSSGQDGVDVQWTGYGVLHQSQTARRQLVLDLDELSQISLGNYAIETTLVASYTDPRQGANGAALRQNRLPGSTAATFAYRMPFGCPDLSQITQVGSTVIGASMGSLATVTVAIVDEDHAAVVSPDFPRADGAGLQEIPSDSSVASATLTCPDLGITDLAGTILSGTGTVSDPLLVEFAITNNTGSTGGIDQINHAIVTVSDADDVAGSSPVIWLDPSLAVIASTTHKKEFKGHVTLLK